MVIVVPLYEEDGAGIYYNTAAVIDADGTYLGKYRKNHIPHCAPGLLGEVLLPARQPRLSGLQDPVRRRRRLHLLRPPLPRGRARAGPQRRGDRVQSVGDRGRAVGVSVEARAAGARGGERVLRRRDQPRRLRGAVAHRRVLRAELLLQPARADAWREASRDQDELVTAELDLDQIREVRNVWQFYRDRRPETYVGLSKL